MRDDTKPHFVDAFAHQSISILWKQHFYPTVRFLGIGRGEHAQDACLVDPSAPVTAALYIAASLGEDVARDRCEVTAIAVPESQEASAAA